MPYEVHGPSSARVDLEVQDNETFQDAFQFDPQGPSGPTGCYGGYEYPWYGCSGPQWSLSGMHFRLDIKRTSNDAVALLSFTSDAGQIIVDDVTNRILHFDVPEATLTAVLTPGAYVFDFVMYDGSTPPIRTVLMHGKFVLGHGISGG